MASDDKRLTRRSRSRSSSCERALPRAPPLRLARSRRLGRAPRSRGAPRGSRLRVRRRGRQNPGERPQWRRDSGAASVAHFSSAFLLRFSTKKAQEERPRRQALEGRGGHLLPDHAGRDGPGRAVDGGELERKQQQQQQQWKRPDSAGRADDDDGAAADGALSLRSRSLSASLRIHDRLSTSSCPWWRRARVVPSSWCAGP